LNTNCLLLIDEDSPLIIAFDNLFGPNSGINAVKSNAKTLHILTDEVSATKSSVIVMEDLSVDPDENAIADLLASTPDLKIIIVLRESNYIYTFKMEETLIHSSEDFLDAVRKESQPRGKESVNA